MSTNVYMIANSSILVDTKRYLETKYKGVVLYGASTVENIEKIYEDINSMDLSSIVYIDSAFTDNELTTTFNIIKEIIQYINPDIKIFFIGSQQRSLLVKNILKDTTCMFSETSKTFTTRLLEEGILFHLLRDIQDESKKYIPRLIERRNEESIMDKFDLGNIEVISVDTNKHRDTDNRCLALLQNIERAISLNTTPDETVTKTIIGNIMSGKIENTAKVKTIIDEETNKTETSKEIVLALEIISNEIAKFNSMLDTDPANDSIKIQLQKLKEYEKNIKLNKARYQYTSYINIMKEATDVVTNSYKNNVIKFNETANKYGKSMERVKEQIEDDPTAEVNKAKMKKRIQTLKDCKNVLDKNLRTYIKAIDLTYNGLSAGYADSMLEIRNLISGAKTDLEDLTLIEGNANKGIIQGITNSKLQAVKQLNADGKKLLALRTVAQNNMKQLLAHTDNINKQLRKINSILELIVTEQDKYISYIETQADKKAIIRTTNPMIKADKYTDKIISVVGVNGTGKTGLTLSTAYSLAITNNKKVVVLDLNLANPQLMHYVEQEPFKVDLCKVIENVGILDKYKATYPLTVIQTDYIEALEERKIITEQKIMQDIPKLLDKLADTYDLIFIILPQAINKFTDVLDKTTRLITVSDTDVSNFRGTTRIVDSINMYLDSPNNINKERLPIKYFIINKYNNQINLEQVKSKCNIRDNEYSIRTFNYLDKITISKADGVFHIKNSKSITNNINWLGNEMY